MYIYIGSYVYIYTLKVMGFCVPISSVSSHPHPRFSIRPRWADLADNSDDDQDTAPGALGCDLMGFHMEYLSI